MKITRPTVVSMTAAGLVLRRRLRSCSCWCVGRRTLIVACVRDLARLSRPGRTSFGRREDHAVALARSGTVDRQVVAAHDDVLRRADDRAAVGRAEDVVASTSSASCASTCASIDSGRWTAIWSPSKSALKPLQTSGWMRIALPSTSTGSNAWMPMRCSVGARFSSTGWLRDHLLEDVPHLLVLALEHLLGRLDRVGVAELLEPADDERLEQLQRDLLGQAALVQLAGRGRRRSPSGPSSRRACRAGSRGSGPACP